MVKCVTNVQINTLAPCEMYVEFEVERAIESNVRLHRNNGARKKYKT